MATSTSLLPAPAPGSSLLIKLMGQGEVLQAQVAGVIFSTITYLLYGGITVFQVWADLLDETVGGALAIVGLGANLVFYIVVRSGRVISGRDPGLARTQLVFGILMMYAAYASIGPASTGLLVVMASHIVYSMFSMKPRQVWYLVGATLTGLVITMVVCIQLWPDRYAWQVQVSSLLYALLIMPLIALLAYKVTDMTQRLTSQHAALESANAKLKELATRDELTRVHNRRHMTELMHIQQAQHRRLRAPLSLALLDLDRFKTINDDHGHGVGDDVLRTFAEVAKQHLRTGDILGRWGGEEFVILMPHTQPDQAMVAMERLQDHLREHSPQAMPRSLHISFSAGVTGLSVDENPQHAVERADQAMYRAKTTGRARSVLG